MNAPVEHQYDTSYFNDDLDQWHIISFDTISSLLRKYKDRHRLSTKSVCLDLGCGDGHYLKVLNESANCLVIGLDMSKDGLKEARQRHDNLLCASGTDIPLLSSSLDFVFSTEVIEHVPEPRKFISEIVRVLKPGGGLVLTTTTFYFALTHQNVRKTYGLWHFLMGLFSEKHRDIYIQEMIFNPWKHLHGFIRRDFLKMIEAEGLEISEWCYINVQPIVNMAHPLFRYPPMKYIGNNINRRYYNKISKVYGPNIVLYAVKK